MSDITYNEFVAKISKPGQNILSSLSPEKCHLVHMAMGASGETGELLDAIKKHVMYQKLLDKENVIEEIGDTIFYLQGICNALNISLEQCIDHNISKLSKRYEALSYSDKAAQERADKQNETSTHS